MLGNCATHPQRLLKLVLWWLASLWDSFKLGQVLWGVAVAKASERFPALGSKVGVCWTLAPVQVICRDSALPKCCLCV